MEKCNTCGHYKDGTCYLDAPKCEWVSRSCERCERLSRKDDEDVIQCTSCIDQDRFEPKKKPDSVNHPAHYEQSCSLECIQVMELVFGANAVRGFCLCNAFKYMWRYKNKNGMEDLKKAQWYLNYVNDYVPVGYPTYEFMGELLDQLMEKEEDGHQI